jgi:N-acyl-D-amino-acid deacylase
MITPCGSFIIAAACAGLPAEEAPPEIALAGHCPPALAGFDRLMLSFIAERRVPGAALAVVKDEKLVLARGYGWADRERRLPVTPASLFRIASLSKPVTAVAILGLAERGRLSLEDKVFDLLSLDAAAGGEGFDERWRRITILQLLRHTAGFDRTSSFDPMFRSVEIARELGVEPPARVEHIMRYMLSRPLDFEPGERYAYSNFGYALLGRVIEKATGRSYEDEVREKVLAPLGIRDMRPGKTLPAERAAGEVAYYDAQDRKAPAVLGPIGDEVPRPYGAWYLEAMDAHGGWLASAVEMARFAAAFAPDGSAVRSNVLGPAGIATMFARPRGQAGFEEDGKPRAVYYGCGWSVRVLADGERSNQWHTGSLDGTEALMVRRHDGLCWVVLFNTRHSPGRLATAIDPLLHKAADEVEAWPAAMDADGDTRKPTGVQPRTCGTEPGSAPRRPSAADSRSTNSVLVVFPKQSFDVASTVEHADHREGL